MRPRAALAIAALLWASGAAADYGPRVNPGWYAPVGMNGGWAIHRERADGPLIGLEGSVVHIDEGWLWAGGYVDALRDVEDETFLLSVGPEVGWAVFGVDAGYVAQVFESEVRHGVALRPMLTWGYVGVYTRIIQIFDEEPDTLGMVGVLIKVPLDLQAKPRKRHDDDYDEPPPMPPPPPAWTPPGGDRDRPR